MRIITGKARGRRLLEPKGAEIRPTTEMVKESIFNIVQFDIEGRRVLDLFAGTGQLGIEALSRGAASCVFVDEAAGHLPQQENLARCGLEGAAVVPAMPWNICGNALRSTSFFIDRVYSGWLKKRWKSSKSLTSCRKVIIICEPDGTAFANLLEISGVMLRNRKIDRFLKGMCLKTAINPGSFDP
jgi:16S rRNA G966 N2-methylase RsmD